MIRPENTEAPQRIFDGELLPDYNSSEAILYGTAYGFIKNAQWLWSSIEDYLRRKVRGLESRIMDRGFAWEVLHHNKSVLRNPDPPFNNPNQVRDVFTLAEIDRINRSLSRIPEYRDLNDMWARKKGLEEYIGGLREMGLITPLDWKACTSGFNMKPITYEYIKGTSKEQSPEENIDWEEFLHALYGDRHRPRKSPAAVPVGEDGVEVPEEPEDPLLEEIAGIIAMVEEDPVRDVLEILGDVDPVAETVCGWLDTTDWDGRENVRWLIQCAEASV